METQDTLRKQLIRAKAELSAASTKADRHRWKLVIQTLRTKLGLPTAPR